MLSAYVLILTEVGKVAHVAQANAWLAMARELAWQRDDYGGRAVR